MRRYRQRRRLHALGYVEPDLGFEAGRLTIQAKMREVNNAVASLQADIALRQTSLASTAPGAAFLRNWASFRDAWGRFYSDRSGNLAAWVGSWFGTLQDQINAQIEQFNGYEEQYRALTREAPSRPGPSERPGPASDGLPTWAWALIVIGSVGVGAYALYAVARVMREGRLIGEGSGALAGLGGPRRVYDLDGPSTYNLEIES